MGNNIICADYYCTDISFKPELLSEISWNINYDKKKPYRINKGVLLIDNVEPFNLLLTKKLLINESIKNIYIPFNFKYIISDEINISIILSNKLLNLNDFIDNISLIFLDKKYFTKNLKLLNNVIIIDNILYKIKSKKINSYNLNLENNIQLLCITEKIIYNEQNIYEKKYVQEFTFEKNTEYFINIFIKSNNSIINNKFFYMKLE